MATRYHFNALGTKNSIVFFDDDAKNDDILAQCVSLVENFEKEFSRFKKDSALSVLNREKENRVSETFLDLFIKSRELFQLTKGFFNPLSDIRTHGYSFDFSSGFFESHKEISPSIDMNEIQIHENQIMLHSGMYLDFSAIGKWYVADLISALLEKRGKKNFLIDFWWDLVARWDGEFNKEGVVAGLANPSGDGIIGRVVLKNESMSTSGTYVRNWKLPDGSIHHHLKNPFQPEIQESHIVSLSVIHQYWYASDALSTGLFVMWEKKALEFAIQHDIKICMIMKNGSIQTTPWFQLEILS